MKSKKFLLVCLSFLMTLSCLPLTNQNPTLISPTSTESIRISPELTPTQTATVQSTVDEFIPTPYYPGLIVFPKIRMEYYDIEGSTIDELLDEMEEKGPIAGIHYERSIAALEHDILFTWPGRGTATCDVTKGELWYTLKVYAPRWLPPPGTPPDLIESWISFMEKVKAHEEGHIELVREYFAKTKEVVATATTCEQAWELAADTEQDLNRAQIKYDREAEPVIFP